MSIEGYIEKFRSLKVNKVGGHHSPHKVCMLLAVLDLARSGALLKNRIEFGPALLERYRDYFDSVRSPDDHLNPHLPFFHLRGELKGGQPSFWHLEANAGRNLTLRNMNSATSPSQVTENIAFAYLDDELFVLLQDESSIDELSQRLAEYWLKLSPKELGAIVRKTKKISRYERRIRRFEHGVTDSGIVPSAIRDPAFRRVVTEIYDYRCAATGLRLTLPDGRAMVQAAHLLPFGDSADDDPRNGIALTPSMHWAMDQFLIAPDPDYRWRVSDRLDNRIPDHRVLTDLDGKNIFLPRQVKMYPRRDALEWRLNAMRST